MTRRSVRIFIMSAFLLAFIASVLLLNVTKPRILILQSYSTGYIWTRDINVGLKRILDKESWVDVHYHYMSTKKKAGTEFLRRAGIAARKMIDDIRPDVLIAIDDNAQKLAATHYINDPKIKIVFAGINGCSESYGYKKASNVTGILECNPLGAVEEVIKIISGDRTGGAAPRVLFISDVSVSAAIDAKYMAGRKWKGLNLRKHAAFDTFSAWKKFVIGAADKIDFLLVGGYREMYRNKDEKANGGKFVNPTEVATWTEANSPVPVIGINEFNAKDGIMISIGSSPYEQGETAAKFAMEIIRDGKSPKEIPFKKSKQYIVAMRKSAMERRHIKVPDVLEAFARATNNYLE